MAVLEAAAWVPYDDRDWDDAAALAAAWVEARCVYEGARAVLVQPTLHDRHVPTLARFAGRHERVSRRSGPPNRPGRGPVLAYVPHADDLYFAMNLARESSLAIVESASFPVEGWAARLSARNLIDGDQTPPLPAKVDKVVDDLKFVGNNAFGDDYGKSTARGLLADVDDDERTHNIVLSALLAAGATDNAVRGLARVMGRRLK